MPVKKGDRLPEGPAGDALKAAGKEDGDERFDPRSPNTGTAEDLVVAVSCDPNLATTWSEIHDHVKSQLKGGEEIGCVIVQIKKKVDEKKAGRWIDYSKPRDGVDANGKPHHITVNKGLNVEKANDVHYETITIINTGGPNTSYRHYYPCYWVCQ